jgi:hypothetical protein
MGLAEMTDNYDTACCSCLDTACKSYKATAAKTLHLVRDFGNLRMNSKTETSFPRLGLAEMTDNYDTACCSCLDTACKSYKATAAKTLHLVRDFGNLRMNSKTETSFPRLGCVIL